jgi:hypothetical protein
VFGPAATSETARTGHDQELSSMFWWLAAFESADEKQAGPAGPNDG